MSHELEESKTVVPALRWMHPDKSARVVLGLFDGPSGPVPRGPARRATVHRSLHFSSGTRARGVILPDSRVAVSQLKWMNAGS